MRFLMVVGILACISSEGFGQYPVRVHAFSQEIIPGVAPAVVEGEIFAPKKRYDYQVFLECKRSIAITLNTIRLNGKLHTANLQSVESPVVQFHPTALRNDTLIQRTSQKVLKVILGKELRNTSRDTVGVMLSYSVRGKHYVQRVRQFKELSPIAMP